MLFENATQKIALSPEIITKITELHKSSDIVKHGKREALSLENLNFAGIEKINTLLSKKKVASMLEDGYLRYPSYKETIINSFFRNDNVFSIFRNSFFSDFKQNLKLFTSKMNERTLLGIAQILKVNHLTRLQQNKLFNILQFATNYKGQDLYTNARLSKITQELCNVNFEDWINMTLILPVYVYSKGKFHEKLYFEWLNHDFRHGEAIRKSEYYIQSIASKQWKDFVQLFDNYGENINNVNADLHNKRKNPKEEIQPDKLYDDQSDIGQNKYEPKRDYDVEGARPKQNIISTHQKKKNDANSLQQDITPSNDLNMRLQKDDQDVDKIDDNSAINNVPPNNQSNESEKENDFSPFEKHLKSLQDKIESQINSAFAINQKEEKHIEPKLNEKEVDESLHEMNEYQLQNDASTEPNILENKKDSTNDDRKSDGSLLLSMSNEEIIEKIKIIIQQLNELKTTIEGNKK